MRFVRCGAVVLFAMVSVSALAEAPASQAPGQAAAPPNAAPILSMECHLLYRGRPHPDPTYFRVIGNELYGVSGPIKTKLSQAGAPVSLGSTKEADGSTTETFASHTVTGTTLERTVFWKKHGAAMKPAFKGTYDFKASTVVSSTDKMDFCHSKGR